MRALKLVLLAVAISITSNTSVRAATLTVDNSVPSPGQYNNLQNAINAASPTGGDTLLVTGTNSTYGTVTIDRPLVLIGAGYYPNGRETLIDNIFVHSSSVFITGVHSGVQLDIDGVPGDSLAAIEVARCMLTPLRFSGAVPNMYYHDIDIHENVITSWTFISCASAPRIMAFDSLLFENNILTTIGMGGTCIPSFAGTQTLIMDHNLFIGHSGACVPGGDQLCGVFSDGWGNPGWPTSSSIISNNIFHLQGAGGIRGCGNCTWFNNITTDTGGLNDSIPGTPLGNENQWDVDPATVLVNYPGGGFDWGHDYSLQAGSPAIGAASDNVTDIGPSGGQYAFVPGTPPRGPYIEYFNVDGSAIEINGDVIIQFKAYGRQ